MNALRPLQQTPKERLQYVASQSKPCPHEVAPPSYLTAIGLLIFMLSMIGVGIVASMVGSEIMSQYARRLLEFVSP